VEEEEEEEEEVHATAAAKRATRSVTVLTAAVEVAVRPASIAAKSGMSSNMMRNER
jgi:hypothetical protein